MAMVTIGNEEEKVAVDLLGQINELGSTLIDKLDGVSDGVKQGFRQQSAPFIDQNIIIQEIIKDDLSKQGKGKIKKTFSIKDIDLLPAQRAVEFYQTLVGNIKLLDKKTADKIKQQYIENIAETQSRIDALDGAKIYHDYMTKILTWLQYLVGYNRAIQNGTDQDNEQQRNDFYFNPIQKIGREKYPDKQEGTCQNGLDASLLDKRSLKELAKISEEKTNELMNRRKTERNRIVSKNILYNPCFKMMIDEIRQGQDHTQVYEEELSRWAKVIESVLNDCGWYLLYYSSKELEGNEEYKDKAFYEGNSVSVEIPAVFEKKGGEKPDVYEWLAGYAGWYI